MSESLSESSQILLQIFSFIVLIFSIVIHEYSHAWMADRLGDPTARYLGRLTLNPIAHVDLIGTVLLPLIVGVGYAKPVPYNPYNLRDQKNGPALVGAAGPASNFLLALIFGIMIRILMLSGASADSSIITFFSIVTLYNVILGVFNLVPIPPLDGSKVLFYFLPYSMHGFKEVLERNWMLLILLFIFFGFDLIAPIANLLYGLFTGLAS